MPTDITYPVHERFYSWQGEGVYAGRAAFFIRLFGCPVKCPWCDSAGTWHPDYVPKHINRMTPEALADEVEASKAPIVIVTGGEPTIHDLRPLLKELKRIPNLRVHLETMGGFPILGVFDWITLSPKWARLPLPENVRRADEIKLIVGTPTELWEWVSYLGTDLILEMEKDNRSIWLHPEWSKRNDPKVLNAITEAVKRLPTVLRAGYQLHKLFKADSADNRSAPTAPLGGNPALGV